MKQITITITAAFFDAQNRTADAVANDLVEYLRNGLEAGVAFTTERREAEVELPDPDPDAEGDPYIEWDREAHERLEADKKFASLSWSAGDVQTLRDDLTEAEAEAFLDRNEWRLRERLTEVGWEVMQTLMDTDSDLAPLPYEDEAPAFVNKGHRVYWLDPDNGMTSGRGTVVWVDPIEPFDEDAIIKLKMDDEGEVECYLRELRMLKDTYSVRVTLPDGSTQSYSRGFTSEAEARADAERHYPDAAIEILPESKS